MSEDNNLSKREKIKKHFHSIVGNDNEMLDIIENLLSRKLDELDFVFIDLLGPNVRGLFRSWEHDND